MKIKVSREVRDLKITTATRRKATFPHISGIALTARLQTLAEVVAGVEVVEVVEVEASITITVTPTEVGEEPTEVLMTPMAAGFNKIEAGGEETVGIDSREMEEDEMEGGETRDKIILLHRKSRMQQQNLIMLIKERMKMECSKGRTPESTLMPMRTFP